MAGRAGPWAAEARPACRVSGTRPDGPRGKCGSPEWLVPPKKTGSIRPGSGSRP